MLPAIDAGYRRRSSTPAIDAGYRRPLSTIRVLSNRAQTIAVLDKNAGFLDIVAGQCVGGARRTLNTLITAPVAAMAAASQSDPVRPPARDPKRIAARLAPAV
jgi:hypothetical protein